MSQSFFVITTVNNNENKSKPFTTYKDALTHATRVRLSSTDHLQSYRLEVAENFGDHSRFVVYDKNWETYGHSHLYVP